MTFGEKLTYCRKQKKISQSALGKISNISGDIIGKYERDEMKPSIETAKKISDALAVTLDYLVGNAKMQIIDKDMFKKIEIINQMPNEFREHIMYFIDIAIKDYKTRQAYS